MVRRFSQQSSTWFRRSAVLLVAAAVMVPLGAIAEVTPEVDPDPDPGTETETETDPDAGPGTAFGLDGSGAAATMQAVRVRPEVLDIVSVYNSGSLNIVTEAKAIATAQQAGSSYAIRGSASVPMQRIVRDGETVQSAPAFMSLPMGTTVFDRDAIGALMGLAVSGVLDANSIVMSAGTASLRGAQAGDVITLRSAFGADVEFTLGAVVADEVTGGTELLMTTEAADRISLSRKSGVVLWGFESREAVDAALADQGLVSTSIRIRRSWDLPDPDSTLGMGATKALLGEFGYRVNDNGSVTQETAWQSANLPSGRVLLNNFIAIRARCHNVIEPALKAAFAEIASVGAQNVFNVTHANTAGGCHVPRFNRLTPNSSIGFLSRHSWGMAIDTNTVGSCQGCAPPDFATLPGGCTAVRIMRKHGFAWGGNFLTPDGMHFEYVGEPRDQLPYPSRYCSNIVSATSLVDADAAMGTQRATLFAEAGLVAE